MRSAIERSRGANAPPQWRRVHRWDHQRDTSHERRPNSIAARHQSNDERDNRRDWRPKGGGCGGNRRFDDWEITGGCRADEGRAALNADTRMDRMCLNTHAVRLNGDIRVHAERSRPERDSLRRRRVVVRRGMRNCGTRIWRGRRGRHEKRVRVPDSAAFGGDGQEAGHHHEGPERHGVGSQRQSADDESARHQQAGLQTRSNATNAYADLWISICFRA